MGEVARRSTPSDAQTVLNALATAWRDRFGEPLRGDVAALLLALSDLETASFKSLSNHNLGNIIAVSDSQDFYRGLDSGNARRFRAYASLQEGADQLINQLTRDSRAEWRDGLLSGDPEGFVRALNGQNGGPAYFEASFDRYLRGFLSRYSMYEHLAVAPAQLSTLAESKRRGSAVPALLALLAGAGAATVLWRVLR